MSVLSAEVSLFPAEVHPSAPTPFTPPSIAVQHATIDGATLADAAGYLVEAFGGETECMKLLGGTQWWQLRLEDVQGEWLDRKSVV